VRELAEGVMGLTPQLVWSGAGLLMEGECGEGLHPAPGSVATLHRHPIAEADGTR
jgi:hypothetical protein